MDNRRLGVITALAGAAFAVVAALFIASGSEMGGIFIGSWTGIPVVASMVLLVMSLVFLSRSGKRQK